MAKTNSAKKNTLRPVCWYRAGACAQPRAGARADPCRAAFWSTSRKSTKPGAPVADDALDSPAGRRHALCKPWRTQAGSGAGSLEDRRRGQSLPRCGRVHRRIHGLPAAARRSARDRDRHRLWADRHEAAQRPASAAGRADECAVSGSCRLAESGMPVLDAACDGCLVHLGHAPAGAGSGGGIRTERGRDSRKAAIRGGTRECGQGRYCARSGGAPSGDREGGWLRYTLSTGKSIETIPSPITGAEGNQEFLLYALRAQTASGAARPE